MLYDINKNPSKAEELFKQVLEQRKLILGLDHVDTIESVKNLASFYKNQRDFENAVPLYKSAMELTKKIKGEGDKETALAATKYELILEARKKNLGSGNILKDIFADMPGLHLIDVNNTSSRLLRPYSKITEANVSSPIRTHSISYSDIKFDGAPSTAKHPVGVSAIPPQYFVNKLKIEKSIRSTKVETAKCDCIIV